MAYTFAGTAITLGHGRGWLDAPAAASLFRLDAALGRAWQITEAGRTYAEQEAHHWRYLYANGPIALDPDTPSIHQKGRAIDTNDRFLALLHEHGWFQTVYRNGVLVEPWHFEYDYNRDQHRNEPAHGGSVTFPNNPEGDELPSVEDIMNHRLPVGDKGTVTVAEALQAAWLVWDDSKARLTVTGGTISKDEALEAAYETSLIVEQNIDPIERDGELRPVNQEIADTLTIVRQLAAVVPPK